MNSPARMSDGGTVSDAVASLETLAVSSIAITNGRDPAPIDGDDDIDQLIGSYSQGS